MHHDEQPNNLSLNEHFQAKLEQLHARRHFLKMGGLAAATAFVSSTLPACATLTRSTSPLGFKAVAASTADEVIVPEGYQVQPFVPWGTPLFSTGPGSVWKGDGSENATDQARQVGDNHDGMHYFPIQGASSTEGLLVINHEYNTVVKGRYITLFGQPQPAMEADQVRKSIHSCGCSVIHVRKENSGRWSVVLDSKFNRRITADTPMRISGPAAGHGLLKTKADPTGTLVLGTLNNCGNGYTPWGTYLTCEENFNSNFGSVSGQDRRTPDQKRYGLPAGASAYGWEKHVARFDLDREPHESNRFGWIVEIDPFNPDSMPVKRTALGRFKHESAAWFLSKDQRVVIYMGDDQANDYIYKFVSDRPYLPGQDMHNRALLDSGRLYVARFDAGETTGDFMGTGEWLLLDKTLNPKLKAHENFSDQGQVLIHARLAADAVGATPMDRPEWLAVHPETGEVYCTLTNHASRIKADEANPRVNNIYGQIIRWREAAGDAAATRFEWDLFALAGNPTVKDAQDPLRKGSGNINAENTFNSPDGLKFGPGGRLWIQTDGNYSNSGAYQHQGNNSLLCADPVSGEIRRFLVGPKECEVTGMSFTPDGKTLFVNIQHPGEEGAGHSHWPDGGQALPRSATVIITKKDGGVIGT